MYIFISDISNPLFHLFRPALHAHFNIVTYFYIFPW